MENQCSQVRFFPIPSSGIGFDWKVIAKKILSGFMFIGILAFMLAFFLLLDRVKENYFYPLLLEGLAWLFICWLAIMIKVLFKDFDFCSLFILSLGAAFTSSVLISLFFIFIPIEVGSYVIPSQVFYGINFILPFALWWAVLKI